MLRDTRHGKVDFQPFLRKTLFDMHDRAMEKMAPLEVIYGMPVLIPVVAIVTLTFVSSKADISIFIKNEDVQLKGHGAFWVTIPLEEVQEVVKLYSQRTGLRIWVHDVSNSVGVEDTRSKERFYLFSYKGQTDKSIRVQNLICGRTGLRRLNGRTV